MEGGRAARLRAEVRGGGREGREDPRGGARRRRRDERGEGARPRGPAADGSPRLRDVRPLPEGPALAAGPAAEDHPAPVLRAVPRDVRAGLLVGDRPAREGRVRGTRRPQGVDARPDPGRGRARVRRRLEGPRGARTRAGQRGRGVRRAEQLPEGDPRHAPRRRVVPLRGPARGHLGLAARPVERRLLARRAGARRRRSRRLEAREARRPGRPPAREARRRPRRPRGLARRGGREAGRSRGAARAAAASRRGPDGRRRPRRDPQGPRDEAAGLCGRPVVLDGKGPARGLRPRGRQARESRSRPHARPRGDPGVPEIAGSGPRAVDRRA